MKIGMVGVGMMGHGIASNLVKHRHELVVLEHPGNQPLDALKASGALSFTTAKDLAAWSDIVITVVTLGMLLGVWGAASSEELWAVGADASDGSGPMVVRGTAARGWERVDVRAADIAGGHLWWVFGPPGQRCSAEAFCSARSSWPPIRSARRRRTSPESSTRSSSASAPS